ncbi:tetratricopeptide repeat protein [Thalassobaculum sp.]|uniref:tetratricopeptide repeat protein n=1 Tax=Thalassobaculum sp. TaxID=2022740 RepID=UPI0032EB0C1E
MSSVVAVAPVLVRQAVREHRSGRLDVAADLYGRALAAFPANPDALHLLGALWLQRGDAVAATPYAAKSLLVDPGLAYAYNNLGLILKRAGQLAAAARCYLQATLVSPTFAEAHSNLGVVLKAEGQTSLAVHHYLLALDQDPMLGETWNNLANALQDAGEFEDAVEAYLAAAELLPDSGTVHYNAGVLLMRLGRHEDALVHLRIAVGLEPGHDGARHLIAAIEGEATPSAPRGYVRNLFDSYACRFDAHLVGELRYRAHRETVELLDSVCRDRHFTLSYDLGCGTGLAGTLVRQRADRLIGVDLSERMLEQADRKRIYDTLICGDIETVLEEEGDAPDLALASDVFIHIGDIEPTVARLADRMAPGGTFAFSIELAADRSRWLLQDTGRYAHGDLYVTGALMRCGFRLLARREVVLRHEGGVPVAGAVFLAVKPGDGRLPA